MLAGSCFRPSSCRLVALVAFSERSVRREHDPFCQPSAREDDQIILGLSSTAGMTDSDMVTRLSLSRRS